MIHREKTRRIMIGNIPVGGGAPVIVQSMTTTHTKDVNATVRQIKRLERSGCEIVRVAVPDIESARAVAKIRTAVNIPVVADIHYNYKLGIEAVKSGADALRINPGNIGSRGGLKSLIKEAMIRKIPVRVGVNAGSLEEDILFKYACTPSADALVESAIRNVRLLEDMGFRDIKVSLKSSDVLTTVEAYRKVASNLDYPLHLGVTEAGTLLRGAIKSSIGIGILLAEGIGDTIRVSLTADPVEEVKAAYMILSSLNLRKRGITLISCPSCGRSEIDLIRITKEFEKKMNAVTTPLTVAIMGCVVNGPGEAREADVGVAGGKGVAVLFRKGKLIKKIKEKEMVHVLIHEVMELSKKKGEE
ncbi:MAG TPA: flavodoxin-dependent (E)-4-hydroxy-3-methylbut-2-enyl-diphosphate synthase [bacterium]